jgi:Domain of unknown function (DUF4262)
MTLDPKSRSGLNFADAKFLANIEQHGWVVTKVAPRVGDTGDSFAYSTGLYLRFGQPEMVMFGLAHDTMHTIINSIGSQMKRGVNFAPDQAYPDLLERYSCQFRLVDKSNYAEHLGWSSWFYESHAYPALQCFWPDKNGFFPWQPECAPGVRELQPFLFVPFPNEASHVQ